MKSQQLESLLIDRAFGELPEEVAALLDAYLAQHPEQAKEAASVLEAITVAEKAVKDHPELAAATGLVREEPPGRLHSAAVAEGFSLVFSARFGLALVAVLLAAVGGFFAGKAGDSSQNAGPESLVEEAVESGETESTSPWARYRLGENGQLAVGPALHTNS